MHPAKLLTAKGAQNAEHSHRTRNINESPIILEWANLAGLTVGLPSAAAFGATSNKTKPDLAATAPPTNEATSPETILLKDYRPESIYKIPVTKIAKAKFPVIDMHSHPYAKT